MTFRGFLTNSLPGFPDQPTPGSNFCWEELAEMSREEFDAETGLYYYGARYYSPRTSIWLSVDPLANNNPHVSTYNFVENNPIMLIDPTGMGPEGPGDGDPPSNPLGAPVRASSEVSENARLIGYQEASQAKKAGFQYRPEGVKKQGWDVCWVDDGPRGSGYYKEYYVSLEKDVKVSDGSPSVPAVPGTHDRTVMVPSGPAQTNGWSLRSNETAASVYLANNEGPIRNSIAGIPARHPNSLISNLSLTFNFSSSGPNSFSNSVLNAFSGAGYPVNSLFGFRGGGTQYLVRYNFTPLAPLIIPGTSGSPAIPAVYQRSIVWQKR